MAGFTLSEWVNDSPEAVMAFAIDPANAQQVIKNVVKMEQVSPGPLQAGTVYRETRMMNGRPATTDLTVTAYDKANGRYSVTAVQSGLTATYHYTFQPEQGGTRINLVCETEGKGLMKLMAPFFARIMKKEDGDHLQNLKIAIETT
jgi:hypothetical protein